MMKNKNVKIQYWILYWILSRIRWIFQLTYICTIMIQYRYKYYCNMYFLKLNTTLVNDIYYIFYCISTIIMHILHYYISYYLLDFILDNWWILSEMCIFCQNWIKNPYWIFTGFCTG